MQVLVHLGLNKCASTYIQQALAAAQARLRKAGVFYPVEGGRVAQYGLSRHYGFGPDADGVTPRSLGWLVAEAEQRGLDRMVLSSEYLSLERPAGIARFASDVATLELDARFVLISRDIEDWVRSLFNQYVKTVDRGPWFGSIDGFVEHVLKSGAIDIARRHDAWADVVGPGSLAHYHIARSTPPEQVLAPFAEFAGIPIPPAEAADRNRSLPPTALYLTGLIRQAPSSAARDLLLGRIARMDCSWVPVPEDYAEIGPEHRRRIEAEVGQAFAALPQEPLLGFDKAADQEFA